MIPNKKGQLNPRLDFDWNYSPLYGGQIRLQSVSESTMDRESETVGLDKSITNVENHLFVEAIPFFYTLKLENLKLKPGIGVKMDWYDIQEVGFLDIMPSTIEYRLFFNNDRQIGAIRPGIFGGIEYEVSDFQLTVDGFYSPWFYVLMNQEFSSTAIGTTVYDTAVTNHEYRGTGTHAWGSFASIGWQQKSFSLTTQTAWEGFSLAYNFLGIGASVNETKVSNITGNLDFLVSMDLINIKGLSPMVGTGIRWNISRDITNNGDWISESDDIHVVIGFKKSN